MPWYFAVPNRSKINKNVITKNVIFDICSTKKIRDNLWNDLRSCSLISSSSKKIKDHSLKDLKAWIFIFSTTKKIKDHLVNDLRSESFPSLPRCAKRNSRQSVYRVFVSKNVKGKRNTFSNEFGQVLVKAFIFNFYHIRATVLSYLSTRCLIWCLHMNLSISPIRRRS